MMHLTKHERAVLIVLAVVIVCGSLLNAAFNKYSGLAQCVDDREHYIHMTDVNRASFDELVRVPFIGEKSAGRIMEHREKFGAIRSLQELQLITRLSEGSLEIAGKYLKF